MKKFMFLLSIFFGLVLSMSANSSPPTGFVVSNEQANILMNDGLNCMMPMSLGATLNQTSITPYTVTNGSLDQMEMLNSSPPVKIIRTNSIEKLTANYTSYSTCTGLPEVSILRTWEDLIIKPVLVLTNMCVNNQNAASRCLNNLIVPPGYQVLLE